MNTRLHRFTALMLVLGSLTASGMARAETPATPPVADQTRQVQPPSAILAWQRVGSPLTGEA